METGFGGRLVKTAGKWEEVEEEVKSVVGMAVYGSADWVVFAGEGGEDADKISEVVMRVLREQSVNGEVVVFKDRGDRDVVDPVFAAAMGTAGRWKHFVGNSPGGCYYSWDCPGAEILQEDVEPCPCATMFAGVDDDNNRGEVSI